ncbi:MAG: c-type cytochrome [Mucilaginibacter sp.]
MKTLILAALALCCMGIIWSCQSEGQLEFAHYYSSGMAIYQAKCQNCHGNKGEGLMALIPPFTDSSYLKNNKAALACMVKYGINKPLNLTGKTFDGKMQGVDLAPVEIAEVLTYITNSFGNNMGTITSDQVNKYLTGCK